MRSAQSLKDQLPLAPHLFQILLSLLHRQLHGYAILKDITDRTGGETTLGTSTLYAALQRLVRDGFLEEVADAESQKAQGPPRKCFRITEAGRALAREEGKRIQRLSGVVAGSGLFDSLTPATPLEEKP